MKSLSLVIFLIPSFAFAFKPLILHSGTSQVNLLELKVSDSCDACEPEEKWVSHLRDDKSLWKKYVIAVEKPDENGTYPIFKLNGEDWDWTDSSVPPAESGGATGELEVARQRLQEFDVAFKPSEAKEEVQVTARFLDQDFITVGEITKKLRKSGKSFASRVLIPVPKGQMSKIRSVVFWVSDEDGKILQALGSNIQIE